MSPNSEWKSMARPGPCHLCGDPVDPQKHLAVGTLEGILPAHLECHYLDCEEWRRQAPPGPCAGCGELSEGRPDLVALVAGALVRWHRECWRTKRREHLRT